VPTLLLFDIDGTLLTGATDAHRDALHEALRVVHHVDAATVRKPLTPAGRTDGEIARTLLIDAGVSAQRIDERSEEVEDRTCEAYARLCPADLSHTLLPGMAELLAWLSSVEDVRLALVTGNYECVARLKLARAGIGKYFPPGKGAFGSDSEDRAALPAIARRRAGVVGTPYRREQTIVIGDTPRDIACARADGVRVIGVATGPYSETELAGADAVVANPEGLRAVLEPQLDHS
jgi:phosphoglycolate phosphatase